MKIQSLEKKIPIDSVENPLMHYSESYLNFLGDALPNTVLDSLDIKIEGGTSVPFHYACCNSKELGYVLNSLPFFGSHGGPLSNQPFIQQKLIEKFSEKIEAINPLSVTLIENPFLPLDDKILNQAGLKCVDFRIGQFTHLPADLADFHVKTRNAIRKGLKLKLEIKKSTDLEDWSWMQSLHERSIKAMGGMPKTMAIYDSLKKAFGDKVELWIGYLSDRPITGLVIIRYLQTVEYFTPVIEETYKDKQALSALIYNVMKQCGGSGSKLWNWGGTWESQTGVYRFKSRWGAFDKPYRYFNLVRSNKIFEIPRDSLVKEFPYYYLYKY